MLFISQGIRADADPQIAAPGGRLLTPEDSRAMDLAIEKMKADFSYSALNNLGDLQECIRAVYQSADFLIQESSVRGIVDRMVKTHLRLNIPDITNPQDRPNPYVAILCRELVANSIQEPIRVNVESVETAVLPTLSSMKRKYGLQMYVGKSDRSGKEAVITNRCR